MFCIFILLCVFLLLLFDVENRKGNEAFLAKNYKEAIEQYSAAIQVDPDNAVYYANRRYTYFL
jgi:hypothetical protein